MHQAPPYSTSTLLSQLDCVQHGFFGARGGVSSGLYASLNCGHSSGDKVGHIDENRRRVAACFCLDASRLHSLHQAHTADVIELDEHSPRQFATTADGMVCKTPGIGLGPLGADCAPVLFADPHNRVIGAAHSGWKGALTGINEAVVTSMLALGARLESIYVAIGPAMQHENYEIQTDFRDQFRDSSPIDSNRYFIQRDGRLYFDTPEYIRGRLLAAGLVNIDKSLEDTYSQESHYFSYRRGCQQGLDDYGRQISVIALLP